MRCKRPWGGAGGTQEKCDGAGGEIHSALTSPRKPSPG